MTLPDKEVFDAWKKDPVTLYVFAMLEKRREALRQAWEGGAFTDYEKDGTILTNVGNMGTCKGYAFVQELDYEQLLMEAEDGN